LRGAVAALARAFSHQSASGDRQLLIAASDQSPLVHWAMRYGAAISSIDAGDLSGARVLIGGAPSWPSESCFALFHQEIAGEVTRRHAPEAAPPGEDVHPPSEAPPSAAPPSAAPPSAAGSPDEAERAQADAFGVVDEEDRSDVER
jgi:hypothetical protein